MNIVNVGYSSTNYYVLEAGKNRLLVDVGLPGSYPHLIANLKRYDMALSSIQYLLCTHYHLDHAGIAEEVKAAGPRLIVIEGQREGVAQLGADFHKAGSDYVPIRLDDAITLTVAESRAFLKRCGFDGEIIATPGHSDDSVSLVCDDGNAFIGDLTLPMMADDNNREVVLGSWAKLRQLGAKRIYPGHGPVMPIDSPMFQ